MFFYEEKNGVLNTGKGLQNLLIHIINRLFAFLLIYLFIYFLFKLIRVCLLPNFKVGSVEEARKAVDVGVDAIIVQGLEAGGHVRGKVSPVLCSVA